VNIVSQSTANQTLFNLGLTNDSFFSFSAYKEAYGDDVVWKHYRRNFKGYWRPDTREKCIVNIVKQ
jgi:hypothetical protein